MRLSSKLYCRRVSWCGREGYELGNGLVRLVQLTGGGHIAEFSLTNGRSPKPINPLWKPPWKTIDPNQYRSEIHRAEYGEVATGKMLSSIVGHSLCLDYFGAPSEEESQLGLSFHGEAPNSKWRRIGTAVSEAKVEMAMSVRLPAAGLGFERQVTLLSGEPIAYFEETVTNKRRNDHFFHWQQHVTLGPPFLSPGDCRVAVSGTKGMAFPYGYGGKELLESSRRFRWPDAFRVGGSKVDLREVLTSPGRGFVAAVLMNLKREVEYVAAVNSRHRLLIGYLFKRTDFPWTAIWEENRTLSTKPWQGRTVARALEFGTTPFPIALKRDDFPTGRLFGTPCHARVPACGSKTVRFAAFLTRVRRDFVALEDLRVEKGSLILIGEGSRSVIKLPALGLND